MTDTMIVQSAAPVEQRPTTASRSHTDGDVPPDAFAMMLAALQTVVPTAATPAAPSAEAPTATPLTGGQPAAAAAIAAPVTAATGPAPTTVSGPTAHALPAGFVAMRTVTTPSAPHTTPTPPSTPSLTACATAAVRATDIADAPARATEPSAPVPTATTPAGTPAPTVATAPAALPEPVPVTPAPTTAVDVDTVSTDAMPVDTAPTDAPVAAPAMHLAQPAPMPPGHTANVTAPGSNAAAAATVASTVPVTDTDADTADTDTADDPDAAGTTGDIRFEASAPTAHEAPAPAAHTNGNTPALHPTPATTSHRSAHDATAATASREAPARAFGTATDDVARPSQLLPLAAHSNKRLTVAVEHDQLGAIRIGAAEERGGIHISLQAADATAGAVLREHASMLGDHLAQSGIAGAQVEVSHGRGAAHREPRPMAEHGAADARVSGSDDEPAANPPRSWRPTRDLDRNVDLLL